MTTTIFNSCPRLAPPRRGGSPSLRGGLKRHAPRAFLRAFGCFAVVITAGASGARADLPANATADQTLDALHDRGKTLVDFSANVTSTTTDTGMMKDTLQHGKIWYQLPPGQSARLHVLFVDRQAGKKPPTHEKQEYLLAGTWLTDRDYRTKLENRYQIAKPGVKVNLFELGKGPFPLPIGQERKAVTDLFDVTVVKADGDDPADTIHLQLVPKPGSRLERKFSQVDIWVDRSNQMPSRIKTSDRNGVIERTTDLTNVVVNPSAGLSDKDFELPPVTGWDQSEKPFEE